MNILLQKTNFKGIIISGGLKDSYESLVTSSVEVFLPFGNKHCLLPSLPEPRFAHTMDGFVICGGDDMMSKYEAH